MEEKEPGYSREQIKEIIEVALETLLEGKEKKPTPKRLFVAAAKVVFQNWPVFVFLVSAIGVTVGWAAFDISPFQSLEKLSVEQAEYRANKESPPKGRGIKITP